MKNITFIIIGSFFFNLNLNCQELFYYFGDQKIEIKKVSNKAIMRYSTFDLEKEKKILAKLGWEIKGWSYHKNVYTCEGIGDKANISSSFFNVFIESKYVRADLPQDRNILFSEYFFKSGENEFVPLNQIIVQVKSVNDFEVLNRIAKEFNIEILGYNKFMPEFYTILVDNKRNSYYSV